jgi:hypothetical protein
MTARIPSRITSALSKHRSGDYHLRIWIYGTHTVGTPLAVNQWFTLPQCITPSAMQMQPRSDVGVDSAVKQTILGARQDAPFSETAPAGAVEGGVVDA